MPRVDTADVCVSEQGSLTIVRRTSTKTARGGALSSPPPCTTNAPALPPAQAPDSPGSEEDTQLELVDLGADNLPPVDTPDACDKAALRSVVRLGDKTAANNVDPFYFGNKSGKK